ncbi:MAG: CBS domain-containing protein [Theionarchaea archaeon]|nr:CBS domain-containing protein [Theionarchaea archaeon]MBU7001456.1 CBS domain-containing protein [Theionarchaea archaeon]MBU7022236.1 CBS domain-containing protein [Theionarchaea archaeon]MBU7035118.1 CBS domain-containing protein [Theionarchaea archaeon]MBU7040252.1 CBS domain-containing protein [Theionarchaea archaeon]
MLVEEIMSTDVITITVPGKRKTALEVMRKHNLPGLPVLKEGTKEIVGFVSLEDLIQHPDEDQLALIMNRNVITISSKADISEVAHIMYEQDVKQVCVVDDGTLVGLVTLKDMVMRGISRMQIEEKCEKYMKPRILSVWQETPIPLAAQIMRYAHALAAVILDDSGQLVGIVDNVDFVKASEIVNVLQKTDIQQESEGEEWVWETKSTLYVGTERLKLPDKPVRELMTQEVIAISQGTTVTSCARKMKKHDIEQLPVIDAQGNLIGILRDYDLLRVLVD